MTPRKILAGLLLATIGSTAMAAHCPLDMKQIDDALAAKPALSAEQLAEVQQYRAEGEALHKAGKHQESVQALAKAKELLKI